MNSQWKPLVLGIVVGVLLSVLLTFVTNLKGKMDDAIQALSVSQANDVDSLRLASIFVGSIVGSLIIGIGYKGRMHFIVTMVLAILLTIVCGLVVHSLIGIGADGQVTAGLAIFGVAVGFIAWIVGFIAHKVSSKKTVMA